VSDLIKILGLLVVGFFVCLLGAGSSAQQAPESLDSTATPPSLLSTDQLKLQTRALPARSDECQLCHTKKSRKFIKKNPNPKREHENISPTHGKRQMSCNMCHDINNHNFLIKTTRYPADFSNSSPVCAHCHNERYRDWKRGLHGKRIGGWARPLSQFNCIDCHRPHSVSFPHMESMPPPRLSPEVILHESEKVDENGSTDVKDTGEKH
jgi:hypothetical protein